MDSFHPILDEFVLPFWRSRHASFDALLTAVLAFIVSSVLVRYWAKENAERPVPYTVPQPDEIQPGWKGEVLGDPKIKARSPQGLLRPRRAC